LKNFKKFEILENEKLTPHFMNLVKKSKPDATVEDIKDDDGQPYPGSAERSAAIVKFYRDLYSKPTNNILAQDRTIEDFLEDVKNHPLVLSAKLTDPEKESLDSDLTVGELDNALKNCNMKSAPGLDGISNFFIKEFWSYLRHPLLKYAKCCRTKGRLTNNFRRAKIRLIPKKGNIGKINNWRPISLLNCLYKILSRAFAARLSKFMDKMTPVAQTGYSTTRRCQEVLITLIDCIQDCKINKKNNCLLSLDIRKAFDTISHDYLNKVYKFFNFGPNIISWLNTLGTGRQACIILENEILTDFFDLERGNAQGDTTSPFCFNLGYQILLFKLNFDLQILGGIEIPAEPPDGSVSPASTRTASIFRTKTKVMAMADDATCITKIDFNSLSRIKNILDEFGKLSGLECNVEKTVLMPLGGEPVPENIKQLGFEIKNEITILGMKLNNRENHIGINGEILTEKIKKQIAFWQRFSLSFPGRVDIAKSFMYSQLNYLGSIMNFGSYWYEKWESLITNYVKGKLNIARDRFFQPVADGGIGLFRIQNFLDSQRVGWLKLALTMDKSWKQSLSLLTHGKIMSGRACLINKNLNPSLYCMVSALDNLRDAMTITNDNYKVSEIIGNKHIVKQFGQRETYEIDFLNAPIHIQISLQVCNFLTFGPVPGTAQRVPINEVRIPVPTITDLQYRQIIDSCEKIHQSQHDKYVKGKKFEGPVDILIKKLSQSKKIRKILDGKSEIISRNAYRYGEITETVPNWELSKNMNALWGQSFLENSVRTFSFKLFNNVLGTNQRVSRFIAGHSPWCTFCTIMRTPDLEEESINHLFQHCPVVEPIILETTRWFWGNIELTRTRKDFMCGQKTDNNGKDLVWNIFALIVKYCIWDCKLKYKVPVLNTIKKDIKDRFQTYCSISGRLRRSFQSLDGLPFGHDF
jgi:hypothetical protein